MNSHAVTNTPTPAAAIAKSAHQPLPGLLSMT